MKKLIISFFLLLVVFPIQDVLAQYGGNEGSTITFLNQSGEPALVKLRGATNTEVYVLNNSSKTVGALGGHHYILVRYGIAPNYTYSQGDSFSVTETATEYSDITITLHKVVYGNYRSQSLSQEDFDSR